MDAHLLTCLLTRDTIKAVRNNEEVVSHNHNHLIDSFNLFCCIAAAVPCWPILWKGGGQKNIFFKKSGKKALRALQD